MLSNEKIERLKETILGMESVVVAYSGGIDSTLLLKVAHDCLGERSIGVTAVSASLPSRERMESEEIARQIGAKHVVIQSHETEDPNYLANASDRCYFCKSDVYARLSDYAREHGYKFIVDGTNADDAGDHRPGRKAARQYGVRSPLQELGYSKTEIRELARTYGLPNWDKPSAACLSSRVPYGTLITIPVLSQVEQAEDYLHSLGFKQLRVRHHDQVARIEIDPIDFPEVLIHRDDITQHFKSLGYTYITLDLAGFRTGSMNEVLTRRG